MNLFTPNENALIALWLTKKVEQDFLLDFFVVSEPTKIISLVQALVLEFLKLEQQELVQAQPLE